MTEFLKRGITGTAFVILMIIMIWWNVYTLCTLLLFILITGMNEYFNLVGLQKKSYIRIIFICMAVGIFLSVFLTRIQKIPPVFILYSLLLCLIPGILIWRLQNPPGFREDLMKIFAGYVYLVIPLSLTFYIVQYNKPDYRPDFLIWSFVLIWTYDSFAYITGVLTGKHKIMPAVSPKKTWEGLIGGFIFAVLVSAFISQYAKTFTFLHGIILSVIVVVAGTSGDFFESYLKRRAGVKDSGKCLPGHGGILDRFDSYLFIAPVVFIYFKLIG